MDTDVGEPLDVQEVLAAARKAEAMLAELNSCGNGPDARIFREELLSHLEDGPQMSHTKWSPMKVRAADASPWNVHEFQNVVGHSVPRTSSVGTGFPPLTRQPQNTEHCTTRLVVPSRKRISRRHWTPRV